MQAETNITKVFSQLFAELSHLTIVVLDKAELHLTASQVSPGTIFVVYYYQEMSKQRVKV